jgi:hypothetical protein
MTKHTLIFSSPRSMLRGAKQSMQKSGYKNCRTHAFRLFNPAFAAKTLLYID